MTSDERTELIDQSEGRILIDRPVLRQDEIEQNRFVPEIPTKKERAKGCLNDRLKDIFPPIRWVPSYKVNYIPGDLISGMTVSMIRLPQVNGNTIFISERMTS